MFKVFSYLFRKSGVEEQTDHKNVNKIVNSFINFFPRKLRHKNLPLALVILTLRCKVPVSWNLDAVVMTVFLFREIYMGQKCKK